MLLEKVRLHNSLNGFRFSAAEFGGVALVLTPFAAYYWTTGRWAIAMVATGIIANALPVALAALRSLRAGEPKVGWAALCDPGVRALLRSDQPHLLADTVTITVCTLVPFLPGARSPPKHRTLISPPRPTPREDPFVLAGLVEDWLVREWANMLT